MLAIVPIFLYSAVVIATVTLFSLCECIRNGDKRLQSQKLDNIFEKYMTAIKRLSDDFPNHQIELHLDIAGEDPQQPRKRVNYIHLREPALVSLRSKGNNKTEGIQMPKAVTLNDPEMQPVFVKDLKRTIEELDRKYSRRLDTIDTAQKSNVDVNMKPILQLLEKGTLVNSEIQKPPEDDMSWLQIKIPN